MKRTTSTRLPRREAATTPGDAPGALDLLEEAAFLLRRLPAAATAYYLAGTVPMVLGTLFFVAEMTTGVAARAHAAEAALGLVLLFTWMKTAQAVAADHALALLEQRPPTILRPRDWVTLAAGQLRAHALGLVAVPLAIVLVAPAGWMVAYFQNQTAVGVSSPRGAWGLCWTQARLWPLSNHGALSVLFVLGLLVFLNVAGAIYAVPWLLRTLLGIDTMFAVSGWNPFNSTFLAVACGLTYLALDPLCKALFILRCFYGHARHTGIDLLVRARAALAQVRAAAAILLLWVMAGFVATPPADAADAGASNPLVEAAVVPTAEVRVDAAELDAALDRVLQDPDYAWRLPPGSDGDKGFLDRFFAAVESGLRWAGEKFTDFLDWLFDDSSKRRSQEGLSGLGAVVDLLVPIVIALVVLALAWLVWRWWSGHRGPKEVAAPAVVTAPALEDAHVTADLLPEDEWLRLARELVARGELRLALRAFFLGSLAALAERGLLVLARHKSNRDYERELGRRGGARGLMQAFADNRQLLERAWYGREPAGADDVRRCEENVRVLLGGGA